jgi:hypothetical protein
MEVDNILVAYVVIDGVTPVAKKEVPYGGTLPLWPTVGQALNLSKNGVYAAAKRGEIAGLMKFGRVYRVAAPAFRRMLEEGHKPADKR